MKKHGIYYGSRPLEDGRYGIVVAVFDRGRWIETDLNKTPWPNKDHATGRAYRAAEALKDNSDDYATFPVIAMSPELERAEAAR